jgi:hypothetical protein
MPHPTAPDNCPPTRPNADQIGGRPSHVYPTTSGRQRLLVASGCMARKLIRDAVASLSWGCPWWQVLGSNQRRLSRRFYRELPVSHIIAVTCGNTTPARAELGLNHSSTESGRAARGCPSAVACASTSPASRLPSPALAPSSSQPGRMKFMIRDLGSDFTAAASVILTNDGTGPCSASCGPPA